MVPQTRPPAASTAGSSTTSLSVEHTSDILARARAVVYVAGAGLDGTVSRREALRSCIRHAAAIAALASGKGDAGVEEIRTTSSIFTIRQKVASAALRDGDAA